MEIKELVALLNLSSWCLVIVVWLFLAVPWVCLQFVIVVFLIILTYYLPQQLGYDICAQRRSLILNALADMTLSWAHRSVKGLCHILENLLASTCDFQQCDILTCVDSDKSVQPTFTRRNSK